VPADRLLSRHSKHRNQFEIIELREINFRLFKKDFTLDRSRVWRWALFPVPQPISPAAAMDG